MSVISGTEDVPVLLASNTRGPRAIKDKYRGCDLVKTIIDTEKELKQVEALLIQAIEALS